VQAKKFIGSLLGAVLLASPQIASAQQASDLPDAKFYIGASAGYGFGFDADASTQFSDGIAFNTETRQEGFAGKVFGGVNINRFLAAEIAYMRPPDLTSFMAQEFSGRRIISKTRTSENIAAFSLILNAHHGPWLNPFVKGGGVISHQEIESVSTGLVGWLVTQSVVNTGFLLGLGNTAHLSDNLDLRLEWEFYETQPPFSGANPVNNFISAGLVWTPGAANGLTGNGPAMPPLPGGNFYLGASAGVGVGFDSDRVTQATLTTAFDTETTKEGFGSKAFAGVDINRVLAAEIAYMQTPQLTTSNILDGVGFRSLIKTKTQENLVAASLVLKAEHSQFFNPFLKGGGLIAYQQSETVTTGSAGGAFPSSTTGSTVGAGYLLGLGNTAHLTDTLDARVEWELYDSQTGVMNNFVSAGLVWTPGGANGLSNGPAMPLLPGTDFYLGASSGFGFAFNSKSNTQGTTFPGRTEISKEGFGSKAFAGISINDILAAEVAYMQTPELRQTTLSPQSTFTSVTRTKAQENLATFSLLFTAHHHPLFNPFVKGGGVIAHQQFESVALGASGSTTTGSSLRTGYLLGLGNAIELSDGLDLRLEWEIYDLGFGRATMNNFLSAGLVWTPHAESDNRSARDASLATGSRFYVGASAGGGFAFDNDQHIQSSGTLAAGQFELNKEGFGAKAFAGVAINRVLAAEVAYMATPRLTGTSLTGTAGSSISKTRATEHLASISLILGTDHSKYLNPFVRGGGVISQSDIETVATGASPGLFTQSGASSGYLLGLGNRAHLTDNLDMRFEWEIYETGLGAGMNNFVSAGLVWKLGQGG